MGDALCDGRTTVEQLCRLDDVTFTPRAFYSLVACDGPVTRMAFDVLRWLVEERHLEAPEDVVAHAWRSTLFMLDWLHDAQWLPLGVADRYVNNLDNRHKACQNADRACLLRWLCAHGATFTYDDILMYALRPNTKCDTLEVLLANATNRLSHDEGKCIVLRAAQTCSLRVNRWMVEHAQLPYDASDCVRGARYCNRTSTQRAVYAYWSNRRQQDDAC